MAKRRQTHVILLRAIGPATHKLMTMSQWRDAAAEHGFSQIETLVNTGNMIADYAGDAAGVAKVMADLLRNFGLGENVAPIIRSPDLMLRLGDASPLHSEANPAQTAVYFFQSADPDFDWVSGHDGPEKVSIFEQHLIVDFTQDVAKSGRLMRKIDKLGGVNTARNWNSVRRIAQRCQIRA